MHRRSRARHAVAEAPAGVASRQLHEEIEGDNAEQGLTMIGAYADSACNRHLIRQAVVDTSLTFDAMWYAWDGFLDG